MREQYDFSQSFPNPYCRKQRRMVTITMDEDTISYFLAQEKETGIPYQHLMNLYLSDCVSNRRLLPVSGIQQST